MAPARVVQWLRQAYPKPTVNEEWLDACCAWVADEMQLNPDTNTDAFIIEVENQLLESDLRDSMETGTGLPRNAMELNNQRIRGTPILVEVTAIMEIGHSAFNLYNVRQARIERADLAGLAQEEGVEDEEGPVPNYPHSMLKLEISDGTVTLPAIEYRALPGFRLDETPLGYKIVLKDVLVRRGVVFLEPQGIVLKGHRTNDRDEFRDRDFVRGLYRRMMKPIPNDELRPANENGENRPPPRAPSPSGTTVAVQEQVRSPLREISEPPVPRDDGMDMDADADLPRKRRIPNPTSALGSAAQQSAGPSSSSTSTLIASRFFAGPSSASTSALTKRLARVLSPVRGDPIDITDSSMEDPEPAPAPTSVLAAKSLSAAAAGKQPARASHSAPTPPELRSKISFEDFEFDDDDDAELDAAFLDEIAKVERAALGSGSHQSVAQAVAGSSAPSEAGTETEAGRRMRTPVSGVPSSSRASSASASVLGAHPRAQAQNSGKTVVRQDVITIDDDEDDDKENVPVPKRRVRRRVSELRNDVIDISD